MKGTFKRDSHFVIDLGAAVDSTASNLQLSWDNGTYQDDPLQHLCCLPSSLTQPLAQLLVLLLQGLVLLHQGLEAL